MMQYSSFPASSQNFIIEFLLNHVNNPADKNGLTQKHK